MTKRTLLSILLELVPDGPQELLSFGNIQLGFNGFWLFPSEHADDSPAELRLRNNHLRGIRRSAMDPAHLGHVLPAIQDVHGKAALHEDDEGMPRPDGKCVLLCELDQSLVIPGISHQAWSGGLAKGKPEFHGRLCLHD